jgi:hypothetical protein
MLRQKVTGKLFPFTQVLAQREDMVVVEMDSNEIAIASTTPKATPELNSEPIKIIKTRVRSPGPGWIKSHVGRWTRKNIPEA